MKEAIFFCMVGLPLFGIRALGLLFSNPSESSCTTTIRIPNSLNPDQDQHFVGPNLDLYCLQRLLAVEESCQ